MIRAAISTVRNRMLDIREDDLTGEATRATGDRRRSALR
jgi:hypothetical protein